MKMFEQVSSTTGSQRDEVKSMPPKCRRPLAESNGKLRRR
jgi:hypothetical protein